MSVVVEGILTETRNEQGQRVYGLRLIFENGGQCALPGVDTHRQVVKTLRCRLLGEAVDAEQARYVAEDTLGAFYDGTRS